MSVPSLIILTIPTEMMGIALDFPLIVCIAKVQETRFKKLVRQANAVCMGIKFQI